MSTFFDYPGSQLYVDLIRSNGLSTALNLYGNLISGSSTIVSRTYVVPVTNDPATAKIQLRRAWGAMAIYDTALVLDRDMDGLDDAQELQAGTDPLYANPALGVLPGIFQAEDFGVGGEGRGYHDTTVGNAGGLYRTNDSVDIVFSIAVLEHVPDPHAAIAELVRILKPGGHAYVFVPFMQGFHAAPHDYQRFTRPGLERALRGLRVLRTESFGPTSGLVWVLGEWLAIPLSLGIAPLQRILALIFQTLLSPLKFLDVLFRRMPGSENISTGFLVVAVKEKSGPTSHR